MEYFGHFMRRNYVKILILSFVFLAKQKGDEGDHCDSPP